MLKLDNSDGPTTNHTFNQNTANVVADYGSTYFLVLNFGFAPIAHVVDFISFKWQSGGYDECSYFIQKRCQVGCPQDRFNGM